jgi:methionyl-tRNA synthetase
MTPYYLTAPIYYVNAKPHLGHAYTTIVADAMTRFAHMQGRDAMFITGTDEHGDKIVQAAAKTGCTPRELADEVSAAFRALWPELDAEPARFVRTSGPEHAAVVRAFLQKVYDAGHIYFGEYGGNYCYGCERFYTEKELENGLCPQHQVKPEYISEKNYFFRMSAFQDKLKRHILDNPGFISPERYRNEALSMLEGGVLDDLCISRPRTRLEWGIELPFDPNYVCYVWFDALLAYTTALGGPDSEEFQHFWPGAEHLVAKDILKPHAVFWPTMLMAADLPLYRRLHVHGYWLLRDAKISKSTGNVVPPLETARSLGLDAFRYFLLREMHFGSDADFSEEALTARYNADLANDLGNLFSRVLSMAARWCAGKVPAPGPATEAENNLKILASDSLADYERFFADARFSDALESLWNLVRALNKYVDASAPWASAAAGDHERVHTVLYTLLECMRKTALYLWPVMPETSIRMLAQLGFPVDARHGLRAGAFDGEVENFGLLPAGRSLAPASNLFPRVETDKNAAAKGKAAAGKGATGSGKNNAAGKNSAGAGKTDAGAETGNGMSGAG